MFPARLFPTAYNDTVRRNFAPATLSLALILGGVTSCRKPAPPPPAPLCPMDNSGAPDLDAAHARLRDWAQLETYRKANAALPAHTPGRVIFYGDSITQAWSDPGTPFFPGRPFLNRGIAGQTTPQLLVRFRQDVLDLHPGAVVILAGINDLSGNTGLESPAMIEGYLRSMAELARANNIRVLFGSILPVAGAPDRPTVERIRTIREINRWLADYCRQQHLTYIDYYAAMATPSGAHISGLFRDAMHPNQVGYSRMTVLAEAALRSTP